MTTTHENVKRYFNWKKFIFITIAVVFVFMFAVVAFFLSVTADARLDINKLTGTTTSIEIVDDNGNPIVENSNIVAGNDDILEHTKHAFIAIEDRKFYRHKGIDLHRVGGAIVQNIKSKATKQGGSTITQQLVKNTHLSSEKTLKRKLNEMKLAVLVEDAYEKDEILTMYLNNIYFGNGCYGIGNACKYYFDKNVCDINVAESAVLAGIVKAPSELNPKANLTKTNERKNLVLSVMKELNYIDEPTYQTAVNQQIDYKFLQNTTWCENYVIASKYEACDILGMNMTELDESNITIETYMVENDQKQLHSTINNKNYQNNLASCDIGMIVMDSATSHITAFDSTGNTNFCTIKRQPGSCIKPVLVYAPAIELNNVSPSSSILDEKTTFGDFSPKNAGNKYDGWISVRESLVKSKNVPAVKLLDMVGLDKAISYGKRLGLEFDDLDYNLSIALGGLTNGETLAQMTGSYSALANSGEYNEPRFVKRILSSKGRVLFENNTVPSQVFSKSTAYLVTDMLVDTVQTGTASKLNNLNFDVASKTGTVGNENGNSDAWNVSYTTQHIVGCLITKNSSPLLDNSINGATYPSMLVRDYLNNQYKTTPKDFEKPASVVEVVLDSKQYENGFSVLADDYLWEDIGVVELFDVKNMPHIQFDLLE